jgi:antitoxin VapB
MTLSIRNPEADLLAKRLAKLDDTTITEAVIVALREAIAARTKREAARETARKILARRGLAFVEGRRPVPPAAYHDLDHNLADET